MKRKICTFIIGTALSAVFTVSAFAKETPDKPLFCCIHRCCTTVCCCPETPNVNCPVLPDVDTTPDTDKPVIPDEDTTPETDKPVLPDQDNTPDTNTPVLPEESPDAGILQLELDAMKLVNEQRAANGLHALTLSSELTEKARIKSREMKQLNYFSHTSPTYGSPFDMMKALGIRYVSAGENIAMGYRTAEAVVNAWMNSPSHRENLLSSRYTVMGIGYADGYWTQWLISN